MDFNFFEYECIFHILNINVGISFHFMISSHMHPSQMCSWQT